MPNPHPRRWRAGSVFGDGPRMPLCRERRARFRFLLNAHRRARRLTPHAALVGDALVRRLGVDGRCDPAHETIAADVGCCARTVRRCLAALRTLGLLVWQRRIVRNGSCVDQTSNAYLLATPDGNPSDGQTVRGTTKQDSSLLPVVSPHDRQAALKGLAAIATARMQALGLGRS